MNEYKILFTGSVGAGKTTAIASMSDAAPIVTDVANSDASVLKNATTVGFDYGLMTLDNGDCVRLFGTPGQKRFDFVWRILAKNAVGLVILTDNSQADPLSDLRVYLDSFSEELKHIPCVVGVSRLEQNPSPSINAYSDVLHGFGYVFPVLAVDTRIKSDVARMIDLLLLQIEVTTTAKNVSNLYPPKV